MRRELIAVTLALAPCTVHAASASAFCKGTMSFVARPNLDGTLTFQIEGIDPRQTLIGVAGNAAAHGHGWRYQVTSATVPEDRCTLDITAKGGGYAIKSFDGARCESSGGHGAYAMLMSVDFPASSALQGLPVPAGSADAWGDLDCARRRFFAVEKPAEAGAAVVGAAPIGVVRGLLMRDKGGWGTVFAEQPTPLMRDIFTASFNRSWAQAMTHNKDEPVLDGDPITGFQEVTRVEERSTTGGETSPTTARVTAVLSVTAGGQTKPETVIFDLALDEHRWKVDDITDKGQPPLRAYFRKAYGSR